MRPTMSPPPHHPGYGRPATRPNASTGTRAGRVRDHPNDRRGARLACPRDAEARMPDRMCPQPEGANRKTPTGPYAPVCGQVGRRGCPAASAPGREAQIENPDRTPCTSMRPGRAARTPRGVSRRSRGANRKPPTGPHAPVCGQVGRRGCRAVSPAGREAQIENPRRDPMHQCAASSRFAHPRKNPMQRGNGRQGRRRPGGWPEPPSAMTAIALSRSARLRASAQQCHTT